MPPDYPVAQLLIDCIAVIREAAVYVVPAAILLGAVNFVVGWFMSAVRSLSSKDLFKG